MSPVADFSFCRAASLFLSLSLSLSRRPTTTPSHPCVSETVSTVTLPESVSSRRRSRVEPCCCFVLFFFLGGGEVEKVPTRKNFYAPGTAAQRNGHNKLPCRVEISLEHPSSLSAP